MTAMTTPRHRVASATAQLRGIADTLVDASVWSMDPVEAAITLVELTRLESQVTELRSRVAAHADELQVGSEVGSTANWLAHQTRQTRPGVARTVRLGYDLATHDLVRAALARGDLRVEQAQVILHAVKTLPEDLDPDLVIRAERHLVTAAQQHDAKALKILGRRLLEVVAPDLADAHEADLLEQEEARAAQATRLTMTDDGHGKTYGRFTLPTAHAARLKKMLLAIAAPKHQTATHGPGAGVQRRPGPERLGRAFVELIERITAQHLPKVGGTDATIVVTIDLDTLTGKLAKAGVLDTGDRISPREARRLACTARIIPVVLGGTSEVLDVGRARRLFTKAQLTAMAVRDGGCVADGCDWPPWLCHAHHWQRWTDKGPTDLTNGGLLCPKHHTRAHDPTYELTHHPTGTVTFHRRP
jgi:hypothetical protein